MDENYHTYLNRLARLALPTTYQSQVQNIHESPKYQLDAAGKRQPVPFPGYTIITPTWADDAENNSFYETLRVCQQQLLEQLEPDLLVPVPADSFHLTLADLIWDSSYRHAAAENPEFESKLRSNIGRIFETSQSEGTSSHPTQWQLLGLIIMPRALGVALLPKDEDSYERVIKLRRAIYQDSGLIGLGIEQQYGFNAHVTLGYFGDKAENLDRDRFCSILSSFNQQWVEKFPPDLTIRLAQLRKFDDMTRYYRQPDWPEFKF